MMSGYFSDVAVTDVIVCAEDVTHQKGEREKKKR